MKFITPILLSFFVSDGKIRLFIPGDSKMQQSTVLNATKIDCGLVEVNLK